jgi:hypothetical protein
MSNLGYVSKFGALNGTGITSAVVSGLKQIVPLANAQAQGSMQVLSTKQTDIGFLIGTGTAAATIDKVFAGIIYVEFSSLFGNDMTVAGPSAATNLSLEFLHTGDVTLAGLTASSSVAVTMSESSTQIVGPWKD